MNYSLCVFLTTLAVVGLIHSAIIPPNTKGCKRDDPKLSECVVNTLNALYPAFVNGDKDYAFPVLDPLKLEAIALSERNGQGLDLALNLKNVVVKGLKDALVEDGATVDAQKQTVKINIFIPTLVCDAIYTGEGKVLLLPVKGAGDANLTLGDLKATFEADYTIHKDNDGKEYGQLSNSKLDFTVKKFNIYLDNLFNGDKTLGTQLNTFLNENWQEILKEFGPILRETLRTIVFKIVNNVAIKVPYEVLLPK